MESIFLAAEHGFPVLGICNGFQILCESHLLPGALTRNADLHFICKDQTVSVENTKTPWTTEYTKGQEIVIPIKNGEGSFQCSDETLAELEAEGRIVLRYVGANPNGSRNNIAGISNKRGNVVGVMPHPEQSIETLTGPSDDGLAFFTSILKAMVSK
jgi:phosphoribosylformylglycinamidine synthase